MLWHSATDGMQQTTCQNGIGMDKRQEATENSRFATSNIWHAQDGPGNAQETRCDRGTCVMQHATDDSHRRTCTSRDATWDQATDSAHYATPGHWGGQQENGQEATCIRHDPTDSNAADDTQGTTCKAPLENVQQKPRNM